jgi:hydrogenase maturation protease
MKTLILALGNPILSDDAVGWEVADRLAKHLEDVEIIKSSAATMDIIPRLEGCGRLIVIDAIQLGTAPPGSLHRLNLQDLADTVYLSSPHDINFATAFQLAEKWGCHIPPDIRIYAIEVEELNKFAEGCTPQVKKNIDKITNQILTELKS